MERVLPASASPTEGELLLAYRHDAVLLHLGTVRALAKAGRELRDGCQVVRTLRASSRGALHGEGLGHCGFPCTPDSSLLFLAVGRMLGRWLEASLLESGSPSEGVRSSPRAGSGSAFRLPGPFSVRCPEGCPGQGEGLWGTLSPGHQCRQSLPQLLSN